MNNNIKNMDKIIKAIQAISIKYGVYFPVIEHREMEAGKKIPDGFYQPISFNLIVFKNKYGIV